MLDALEEIFARDGLAVTIGELASRARCSRRTLYELAPSKEELFLLVLDRMMRRLGKAAREAAAAERIPEREMEAFLGAAVPVFQPLGPAFMEAIESYAPAGWLFDFHLTLTRDFVIETIERGIANGDFRELHPELAAEAVIAAVRRVTEPRVLGANDVSAAAALEELFRLALHGLVDSDATQKKP